MRYLAAALFTLLVLAAPAAWAQEATLTTPEVLPSPEAVTRLVVSEFMVSRTGGYVTVEFRGASAARRTRTYPIAAGELASFATALDTAVGAPKPAETGGILRRMSYRVICWLLDNNKILDDLGVVIPVTPVP